MAKIRNNNSYLQNRQKMVFCFKHCNDNILRVERSMIMEKKNTGFKVLLTIISLGITFSLFGKFNFIEKIEVKMSEDKEKETEPPMQNQTPELITETEPNTTPVPNPIPVPTAVPEPQPIVQPTMRPLSTPEVTSEIDIKVMVENSNFEKKQFQPTNDPGAEEQKTSENDNTTDNSHKSFTQDNNLSETNEDTKNALCQFEFESPGRFVLTSKNDNPSNADGTIDVDRITEETGDGQESLSYKYSDLVNNEEASEELTSFISVTQGTYIVKFVNCDFDNVNFYFENSNDISQNNTVENSEESYEEIIVPTNEYTKIEISKDNPIKIFKASFTQGFKPLINFYSDNLGEKNLILKILDENKFELQHVDLNYVNPDGSRNFTSDFSFEDGKEYYIQVSSVDNVELSQTCYLMISQIVEEVPLETNHE